MASSARLPRSLRWTVSANPSHARPALDQAHELRRVGGRPHRRVRRDDDAHVDAALPQRADDPRQRVDFLRQRMDGRGMRFLPQRVRHDIAEDPVLIAAAHVVQRLEKKLAVQRVQPEHARQARLEGMIAREQRGHARREAGVRAQLAGHRAGGDRAGGFDHHDARRAIVIQVIHQHRLGHVRREAVVRQVQRAQPRHLLERRRVERMHPARVADDDHVRIDAAAIEPRVAELAAHQHLVQRKRKEVIAGDDHGQQDRPPNRRSPSVVHGQNWK